MDIVNNIWRGSKKTGGRIVYGKYIIKNYKLQVINRFQNPSKKTLENIFQTYIK